MHSHNSRVVLLPHRLSGSRDDENTQREARASLHTCDVIKRHGFPNMQHACVSCQTEKARGILAHVFNLSPNYLKRQARWKSFNGKCTNCFTKRFNVTFCGYTTVILKCDWSLNMWFYYFWKKKSS